MLFVLNSVVIFSPQTEIPPHQNQLKRREKMNIPTNDKVRAAKSWIIVEIINAKINS